MPSSTTTSFGGDEIRSRDGTTCRQGTHATPVFDSGISSQQPQQFANYLGSGFIQTQPSQSMGVYARIVIPFGKDTERVDCTKLYALEIERLQLEVERMKASGSASITIK